jgi:hypothetical protein
MRRFCLVAAMVLWATSAAGQVGPKGPAPASGSVTFNPNTVCFDGANQDTCLTRSAAGTLQIASVGVVNNEVLTIDLETIANVVTFDTTTAVSRVDFNMGVQASQIEAAESFKYGFAVTAAADAAHDINVAAGFAQSDDRTHQINAAALAGKQLDVAWALGAADGMLGEADQAGATAILTFSRTANPDTITSDEASFTLCNDGGSETGTVLINEGSTNDGIYEVVDCTDMVVSVTNDTLPMDEVGDADEYTVRFILPNTWYHVFVIEGAGTEDYCMDRSVEAATCLSESTFDQWKFLTSRFIDGTGNIVNP